MRLSLPVVLSLSVTTTPLFAAPAPAKAPQKSAVAKAPVVDPIFAPAILAAGKIRAAQKTVKPTQKFNLVKDDPRLAPSLELNESLLKVVTSPSATVLQKRSALNFWRDFYEESQSWKPYYFLGSSVPNETMAAMRDFALSQLQVVKVEDGNRFLLHFSTFAIFSADRKWEQAKAQELLTATVKYPLREWALQIRMGDNKAPLAERLSSYRELVALPKTVLTTRDYYFTNFHTGLRYGSSEEKNLAKQLQEEVFASSMFSPSTRFDEAVGLSVDAQKPTEKLAIYDKTLQIAGLKPENKVSLLHWKGQLYADSKDYPNALKMWDEAAKQAGDKFPKQRAEARFAAANLHTTVLKKPADARPLLDALTGDENLYNDQMLQVVIWRADLELNKNNANARKIIEDSLLLKKFTVQQKDFLRFQQAQILVLDKDHTAAIELIKKIPVQNLNPQVQNSGFDSMFGLSLDLKNYDGAKAVIDLWAQRGGLNIIDYAILNGLVFEARGNLPAALGVYRGVLPSITVQSAKDDINAAIKRVEAAIAASKTSTP